MCPIFIPYTFHEILHVHIPPSFTALSAANVRNYTSVLLQTALGYAFAYIGTFLRQRDTFLHTSTLLGNRTTSLRDHMIVLLKHCGPDALPEREALWIRTLHTLLPHGLNFTYGKPFFPYDHSSLSLSLSSDTPPVQLHPSTHPQTDSS